MAVNVLKSYLKDWESVLLKIRLYVFCPELLVNSVYISSRFYYLLRMFQLHSSLIYIYIFFQFLQYSTLTRILGIFSLPIRRFTCVCQFLACKVFFVSIVTTFIYFLQLQSLLSAVSLPCLLSIAPPFSSFLQ